MSVAEETDAEAGANGPAKPNAILRALSAPRFGRPSILPEAGTSGGPLTAVIAVMCFLATLTLIGVGAVTSAARTWTSDLSGAVTVQIKGETPDAIEGQTEAAMRILSETPGVAAARPISRRAAAKMLEPWLGEGNLPASLPIPALIEVDLDPRAPPDLEVLRTQLAAAAPLAALDDHRAWNDRLLEFGRALQIGAFAALSMILGATAAIVVFAARAGLAANADIVEVLHLIGAEDRFVAAEVQRHFFVLGLKGAGVGVAAALSLMLVLAGVTRGGGDGLMSFFLPEIGFSPSALAWLLIVPSGACALTTGVARYTVLRELGRRL